MEIEQDMLARRCDASRGSVTLHSTLMAADHSDEQIFIADIYLMRKEINRKKRPMQFVLKLVLACGTPVPDYGEYVLRRFLYNNLAELKKAYDLVKSKMLPADQYVELKLNDKRKIIVHMPSVVDVQRLNQGIGTFITLTMSFMTTGLWTGKREHYSEMVPIAGKTRAAAAFKLLVDRLPSAASQNKMKDA